jgi:hypothetical protein
MLFINFTAPFFKAIYGVSRPPVALFYKPEPFIWNGKIAAEITEEEFLQGWRG